MKRLLVFGLVLGLTGFGLVSAVRADTITGVVSEVKADLLAQGVAAQEIAQAENAIKDMAASGATADEILRSLGAHAEELKGKALVVRVEAVSKARKEARKAERRAVIEKQRGL